jgi:DNA-directed RNA polymerase subunit RPC12/RpoP
MIENTPLTPRVENDKIHAERHTCGRLLIVVKLEGLELVCPKCNEKVIYTWRKILMMQLMAWA